MRLEASPFHNPVSACKASDAGIIGTYTAIDPAGVVHHRVGKANLGAGVYKYNYSVIRSFLLQEARAFSQIEGWCNMQWFRDNMLSYDGLEGALTF